MNHFEIDLPTAKAERFDRVLDGFLAGELLFRPDIDVRVTRYSKEPGVERRAVFMSSPEHMSVLLHRLHMAVS